MIFGIAAAVFAATLTSASNNDNIITKEKGMIIVNTTELTRDVKGFKGSTPVKIYIKKNKVVKVEALPNQETPRFFDKVKPLLKYWEGKPVSKAIEDEPDAITGATYSSDAIMKNVQIGLEYYKATSKQAYTHPTIQNRQPHNMGHSRHTRHHNEGFTSHAKRHLAHMAT